VKAEMVLQIGPSYEVMVACSFASGISHPVKRNRQNRNAGTSLSIVWLLAFLGITR